MLSKGKLHPVFLMYSGDRITCLCLYEYILNPVELKEKWQEVKEGIKPHVTSQRISRWVLTLTGLGKFSLAYAPAAFLGADFGPGAGKMRIK